MPENSESTANPPSGAPAETSAKSTKTRQPLLKDKDDAEVPPAKSEPPPRAAARQAAAAKSAASTQSRVSRAAFFTAFGLLLGLFVAAAAAVVWFYQERILPELRKPNAVVASPQSAAPVIDAQPLESALQRANSQIASLQKQLDSQRQEREKTQARLQEMADRMALVIQQSSFVPQPAIAAASDLGKGEMPAALPSVSPSTSELILLKERNRLSGFADQAIATGNREALQRLVEAMMDPDLKNLTHAAQAEYRRVQAYYEVSLSIDPNFKLPVQELFKDSQVRAEADVTGEQLQQLLQDHSHPWEVRLRAAYLLRASTAAGTDAALLKALKEDPSLDVAKQAQTSLERRIGRRFRLFDIPAIEAWWQSQGPKKSTPVPMKEPAAEAR